MTIRAFSYGGGIQSTAALVLAAEGRIDFATFLFSNVGDRAENPATLTYLAEHALPYAAAHDLDIVELRWVSKGRERDLYDDLLASERDIPIPVRLGSGSFANRKCTARYKIEVVARELRKRGGTREDPAVIGIGISTDEVERAHPGVPKQQPWTTRTYPLLDLGISRHECEQLIHRAGLPQPPKSACWFCPYQSAAQWNERRQQDPETFARAVALEATLNERRVALGRDRIGLRAADLPLDQAVADQPTLDGFDCESGYCMT